MRRLIALGIALALLAAPLVSHAPAQPVLLGPGGLVNSSGASVSVTNTTTATSLYSYTIPASLTQGNFSPLHLKLVGTVTTNVSAGGVGTLNVGCNYGGSTASISLVNAVSLTAGQVAQPWTIDLWLSGYTDLQSNGIKEYLQGRMGLVQAAATETVYSVGVAGTTAVSSPQTITCVAQWASASATNSLVVQNGKLVVGD